jgi:hypothetical protein
MPKKRVCDENTPVLHCVESAVSSNESALKQQKHADSISATPVSKEAEKQRRALLIFEAELQQRLARRQGSFPRHLVGGLGSSEVPAFTKPYGRPLKRNGSRCFCSQPRLDSSSLQELAACMQSR